MNDPSILKSDIFFFVATVSVTFITVIVLAGFLYVLSILQTIRGILKTARTGTEAVVEGLHEAKSAMHKEGFAADTVVNIFKKLYRRRNK